MFGLQTSESNLNQQVTSVVKNNETSQQSLIECDLSNDSTYSRLNDNSSSDNSSMYTYFSLPNDSSLVSFSHQEAAVKIVDFNDWSNKHVPEPQKKVVTKAATKVERSPPVKKTFICPVCNKLFASKSNLERHGVVHCDVKPFQCVECKRMFSRKVHLERHKFLHMEHKPFNCEICKKGFTQKTHLAKHQYIHTGVKPFPCTACEKTFARKESLNRHKLTHTNEKKDIIRKKDSNLDKTALIRNNIKKEVIESADIGRSIDNCIKNVVSAIDDGRNILSKYEEVKDDEEDYDKPNASDESVTKQEAEKKIDIKDNTNDVACFRTVVKEEIMIKGEVNEDDANC